MISAFLTGFLLGLSLIMAIGAQNAFVLRQGISQNYVFIVALFCAISDAFLIVIGISGIAFFFNSLTSQVSNALFGISAIWLTIYGLNRLINAFKSTLTIEYKSTTPKSLLKTLSVLSLLTFLNPHVYLDTVILIGTISQKFMGTNKILFGLGACLASFIFFFSLSYGARLLTPIMKNPFAWRILDGLIAIIMFIIAFNLAVEGNWM